MTSGNLWWFFSAKEWGIYMSSYTKLMNLTSYNGLLVGGLEHFLFFNILGIIIPTDFHIFQDGWSHQPANNLIISDKNIDGKQISSFDPIPGLMPKSSWSIFRRKKNSSFAGYIWLFTQKNSTKLKDEFLPIRWFIYCFKHISSNPFQIVFEKKYPEPLNVPWFIG